MTYRINGTAISPQPTSGQWLDRQELGVDGNAHYIYPLYREFEMRWEFTPSSNIGALQTFFNSVGTTGTCVVELPKYGNPTWAFYAYTGCVLREPTWGEYFQERAASASMLVIKIRT